MTLACARSRENPECISSIQACKYKSRRDMHRKIEVYKLKSKIEKCKTTTQNLKSVISIRIFLRAYEKPPKTCSDGFRFFTVCSLARASPKALM